MYRQQHSLPSGKDLICPNCEGRRFLVRGRKVACTNCGWSASGGDNKYGAKRTEAKDGIKRDSKYEATIADELLLRKHAGDILDYDSQYKIEVPCYRQDGSVAFTVKHKVDFRIHHKDLSFELCEAKGMVTEDYRWRRKFLEEIWLPAHPDHIYTVVKQSHRRLSPHNK